MSNRIILTIVISFCFIFSYAQCDDLLLAARSYKDNGEYGMAVKYYNQLEKQCPKYFTEKVKGELKMCEEKLKSQNKPKPQNSSSGYVPTQRSSTGISNREFYFDGDGNCRNNTNRLELYWNDWDFLVKEDYKDWLKVERQGNSLLVTCSSNYDMKERNGEITIFGEINTTIIVHQDKRKDSPKSRTRTNHTTQPNNTEQPNNNLSITVKISFETGKAKPTFENVGKLLGVLEDNKNFGLQIELPWCSEQKSEIYITNKYSMSLMKKRIKNITDYFVNSGIAKERIAWSINESNTDCDSGYVKLKDLNGESSK